ncbi:TPA: hypothetical protein PXA24_000020 [Mannheimia haemolytica]|nr:hypothetical protein [Mannheimia haemolytica]
MPLGKPPDGFFMPVIPLDENSVNFSIFTHFTHFLPLFFYKLLKNKEKMTVGKQWVNSG